MGKYIFGIDVGGTSVKCGLFCEEGSLLEKWEIPTRTEENGKWILPDVSEAILGKWKERGDHRCWCGRSGSGFQDR